MPCAAKRRHAARRISNLLTIYEKVTFASWNLIDLLGGRVAWPDCQHLLHRKPKPTTCRIMILSRSSLMQQQEQAVAPQRQRAEGRVHRNDHATAALVQLGITLQQIHGTRYAAQFLREKNVDLEVVMRVLLNIAGQRRHDDFIEELSGPPMAGARNS
jgi:hypothetical protein